MVEKINEALPSMFRASPPWFALLAVVAGFLGFLDRQEGRIVEREKRAEVLANLRIETCHNVQGEATAAIRELNRILTDQSRALDRLSLLIETNK